MTKIIKSTTFYTIGNILPQAGSFIMLPIYTRYLSPGDYGIVNSMQVFSAILTILFTLAIDRSIYRLYYDYKTESDKRDYLGTISISIIGIATIILSLLFLFRGAIAHIYESIEFYPFYLYTILAAYFAIFSIIPKIYLQINEKAGKYVILSIWQYLLTAGFALYFIVGRASGAEGMLKGFMMGNMLLLPIFIYIIVTVSNFKFKLSILKNSLMFSWPLLPGLLSAWILNLSDRVFIERYFDLHDVGIYSLGYKIAGLVLILSNAFILAYNPIFYKLANSDDQISAKRTLYNYNNAYITVVMTIAFLMSFLSREAIYIFLDSKYYEAYKIVPLISIAYVISIVSGLFNIMIYQDKKVAPLALIGISGAFINILLNMILIKPFGIYGAAYATIISFVVIFILSWRLAKRCYYIPANYLELSVYFISGIAIIGFFTIIDLDIMASIMIKPIILSLIIILIVKKHYKYIIGLIQTRGS